MPSRSELRQFYDAGARLTPAIHQPQDWPYEVPHTRYEAYMWPLHVVRPAAPFFGVPHALPAEHLAGHVSSVLPFLLLFVFKYGRRSGVAPDIDVGLSLYYGFPYYGRWIWSAARMLVDKNHVSLTELQEKIAEVRARYANR